MIPHACPAFLKYALACHRKHKKHFSQDLKEETKVLDLFFLEFILLFDIAVNPF